ncbi:hypothetical protein MUN35_21190, partial [Hafnia paralvei]|uniref:hypothetical protein n=1 Tax=Hafnia paralvei TaxID=546367 RepID=UPI001FFEFF44
KKRKHLQKHRSNLYGEVFLEILNLTFPISHLFGLPVNPIEKNEAVPVMNRLTIDLSRISDRPL